MEEYNISSYANEGYNQSHNKFTIGKAALIHSIKYVNTPSYIRKAKRTSFPKNKNEQRIVWKVIL